MAWMQMLTRIKYYAKGCLYEISCCDLCGQYVGKTQFNNQVLDQALLCQCCIDDLPHFKIEIVYANLLNWPAVNHALPDIDFDRLFAISPYIYPFDLWLAQLKYSGRFELARLFASLLVAQWITQQNAETKAVIDLVISIPLHTKKWQVRGFNQAHLIGQFFAKKLSLTYDADLVKKIKNTASQMGKTGKQRRKNLKNTFILQKKLTNNIRHVVIVDDVVTTGSTASEVSRLLKNAGVKTVSVVSVCLALGH
jgi:ComF family protein